MVLCPNCLADCGRCLECQQQELEFQRLLQEGEEEELEEEEEEAEPEEDTTSFTASCPASECYDLTEFDDSENGEDEED